MCIRRVVTLTTAALACVSAAALGLPAAAAAAPAAQARALPAGQAAFSAAPFTTDPSPAVRGRVADLAQKALAAHAGDIFGTMVEFYADNPVDTPDYTMGELININGDRQPLRWMYQSARPAATCAPRPPCCRTPRPASAPPATRLRRPAPPWPWAGSCAASATRTPRGPPSPRACGSSPRPAPGPGSRSSGRNATAPTPAVPRCPTRPAPGPSS
ncbi:exported hypothetical protein [Actinacidiphila bryophytorum]|uniref:Uncharacterized protein n=1 Tax=Actinacidiphila bryophytorum TaxID=1436133 RepID=A0A9W4MGH7_9ACTN|nr:exported hypothetical protein [Actinacidiphila bryophytorum]